MKKFELKQGVNEKDRDIILKALLDFNTSKVPLTQEKGLSVVNMTLRDENDSIVAALMSRVYGWNAMEISVLWVHEDFRGQGLGKQLMEKAEARAKEMECTLIHLNTFDFQAPDFYKKLGYSEFGVLDNSPTGHKMYFLKKDI